jgi:flagellin
MSSLFRINNNIAATFAQRQLTDSNRTLNEANERLASGKRINSAADDAAGLAISEKLRQNLRGLKMAERNAQDGISVIQTAEGGMQNMTQKLQRIRELSVQAANDSLTNNDRELIQNEVDQLVAEIDRTASTVQFNNRQLLKNDFGTFNADGTTSVGTGELVFHTGANRDETITVDTNDVATTTAASLNVRNGAGDAIDLTTRAAAESAIEVATNAINSISTRRARLGAIQNRLEGTIDFLQVQQENVQASESRIRDADIANETVKRTRSNILLQAGTSVLSQAQQTPQLALQLLG